VLLLRLRDYHPYAPLPQLWDLDIKRLFAKRVSVKVHFHSVLKIRILEEGPEIRDNTIEQNLFGTLGK